MTDIAVITGVGASNGLGGALCRRFAAGGLHTLVAGRTEEKVIKVADEIKAQGGSAEPIVSDATDEAQVNALFKTAGDRGAVKAVVFNVGNNGIIPFEQITADQFEEFWRLCCFSGFLTSKAALPLLEKNGGSLLFTGASASLRGRPNFGHFASAKAALRSLAQALAREYGPKGVHVAHVVVDGVINGDFVRGRFGDYLDQLGEDGSLKPDDMAEAFWQLHVQPRTTWTHEIDLRPFKETW